MNGPLMTVGRFAAACRLSVKTLHHYDAVGVLVPVRVDPVTGYRYYEPDQVRIALTIGLLRSLDVPLPAIKSVLREPASLAPVLERERERLRRKRPAPARRWPPSSASCGKERWPRTRSSPSSSRRGRSWPCAGVPPPRPSRPTRHG